MERDNYLKKLFDMLDDHDTYIIVNKDPTNRITTDFRSLLRR